MEKSACSIEKSEIYPVQFSFNDLETQLALVLYLVYFLFKKKQPLLENRNTLYYP